MCFTQHAKISSKSIYFSPTAQRAASSSSQPITQGCERMDTLSVTSKCDLLVLLPSAANVTFDCLYFPQKLRKSLGI